MKELSRRSFVRQSIMSISAVYFSQSTMNANSAATEDVMDEALQMLASTGPEYHGGLANHGPMAAEAIVAMGRNDSVTTWVEKYRKNLQDHPSATGKITKTEWRERLGNFTLAAEWIDFFDRELKEKSWQSVVSEWVTNLAPGLSA
ncbi:MAG TPA: questin oxidase family protein, partial [Acidobacteriota bacterium]|nr:questin oxidase family protein [Acidobacteriota bacterium]